MEQLPNFGTRSASWGGYIGDHVWLACLATWPQQCWKELCKQIQHCCATLRRSRNWQKKCWESLGLKFGRFQTLLNNSQQNATICSRVCKWTQHVISNNVASFCRGIKCKEDKNMHLLIMWLARFLSCCVFQSMSFSLLLISFFLELNVQFPFLSFSFVFVLALFVFFLQFFLSWERQGWTSFALYLDIIISRHCIFNNYSTSMRWIGVGYNHLISNKSEWHNCFIKNAHKISRILPNVICKNNRFSACC